MCCYADSPLYIVSGGRFWHVQAAQWPLLALGAGVRVGVDLEVARPRPHALGLAARYFTAPEARWLAGLPQADHEHAFLRLWCAKEAVLKAHGHGLSFGLHRLRFESRDGPLQLAACDAALGPVAHWSLREFEPAAGYLAALAWRRMPDGAPSDGPQERP